tara:strand:+ start:303 stop:695 length:393 start_codon:yes stop_codon:yes gene_type:complete
MRRKQFLEEFLGALGAREIHWEEETESSISGTVIYEPGVPDEAQNFIWWIQESEVPSSEVKELASLIKEQNLLSIDQIRVSREELRRLYSIKLDHIISDSEFLSILETLESVEVAMVDEGKETDVYFIHE